MNLLNDYNSKEIAPCSEVTGMCDLNVLSDYDVFTFCINLFVYLSAAAGVTLAAEPQFVLTSDDGYTFTLYFRHEPPPVEYIADGLSPLHARVMALFDDVTD